MLQLILYSAQLTVQKNSELSIIKAAHQHRHTHSGLTDKLAGVADSDKLCGEKCVLADITMEASVAGDHAEEGDGGVLSPGARCPL